MLHNYYYIWYKRQCQELLVAQLHHKPQYKFVMEIVVFMNLLVFQI